MEGYAMKKCTKKLLIPTILAGALISIVPLYTMNLHNHNAQQAEAVANAQEEEVKERESEKAPEAENAILPSSLQFYELRCKLHRSRVSSKTQRKALLKQFVALLGDINKRYDGYVEGTTLLIEAIGLKDSELVNMLLIEYKDIDINVTSDYIMSNYSKAGIAHDYKTTALHHAIRNRNNTILKLLLAYSPNICTRIKNHYSLFKLAINISNNAEMAKTLIAAGFNSPLSSFMTQEELDILKDKELEIILLSTAPFNKELQFATLKNNAESAMRAMQKTKNDRGEQDWSLPELSQSNVLAKTGLPQTIENIVYEYASENEQERELIALQKELIQIRENLEKDRALAKEHALKESQNQRKRCLVS